MDKPTIELKDLTAEQKQANFEATLRQVLSVDKTELNRRLQADKDARKQERSGKQTT